MFHVIQWKSCSMREGVRRTYFVNPQPSLVARPALTVEWVKRRAVLPIISRHILLRCLQSSNCMNVHPFSLFECIQESLIICVKFENTRELRNCTEIAINRLDQQSIDGVGRAFFSFIKYEFLFKSRRQYYQCRQWIPLCWNSLFGRRAFAFWLAWFRADFEMYNLPWIFPNSSQFTVVSSHILQWLYSRFY